MEKICTECGHIGQPKPQGLGSFMVDLFLWFFISGVVMVSFMLPLMLIPLGWTIYHLLTYFTVNCPACENYAMVDLYSSKGLAISKNDAKVSQAEDISLGQKAA